MPRRFDAEQLRQEMRTLRQAYLRSVGAYGARDRLVLPLERTRNVFEQAVAVLGDDLHTLRTRPLSVEFFKRGPEGSVEPEPALDDGGPRKEAAAFPSRSSIGV